jgi:integrase
VSDKAIRVAVVGKRAYGTGSLRQKHGSWYGSWYTPERKRTTRKLGPVKQGRHGLSKTQAEQALRQAMLADLERPGATPQALTVGDLGSVLSSRLERQGRKPSHVESVRYHLKAHILPLLGGEPADLLGVDDVQRLVDRLVRLGRSPKTIRNVIGTLHATLEIAVERGARERNPCRMVALPVDQRERPLRFLTQAELARVLAAEPPDEASQLERDYWPPLRLLVLTAAMTGMRLGELSALRWDDLDMGAMKVRVRRSFVRGHYSTPKSHRSMRAVPLAAPLVAELDTWHKRTVWNQDHDLVFAGPYTGRPINRRPLLAFFKRALERAEVRPVRIHDLRHTFATTVAASGGVSLRTLQEWMGHLDARTTQIYADYMPGEREAELLTTAFGLQMDSKSVDTTQREGV